MTQTTFTMSKSLADENRSRDIRRRVEVIHKKLADLQDLGIPCAFCYSSTRNTGSIFTLGDSRITDVIERHKNEIHINLTGENSEQNEGGSSKEIHLILPPLPSPLENLNRHALQSLIVGILKDLGLKWTDPKPSWWPLEVPFVHPRSMPPNFNGNWIQALRKVLESVYSYFSYDVNEYIANQLGPLQQESIAGSEMSRPQPQARLNTESDSERESPATTTSPKGERLDETTIEKKPKAISNFTVENILMGPQHSSSSSSQSPSSTGSNQPSPTNQIDYSSVLPGNWVSHPPVKYTKYTMLSPVSMGEDSRVKRKSKTEACTVSSSQLRRHSSSVDMSPGLNESPKLGIRRVPSNPITRVSSGEQLQLSVSSKSRSSSTSLTGAAISKLVSSEEAKPLQSNSLSQSHTMLTKSVSTLPVIQAIPYSSPGGKAVLHQNFPPSQQFVLLVPSTSTSIGEGVQAVVYTNQTQLSSNSPPMNNTSKTRHTSERVSDLYTTSNSPPHTSTSDADKRPLELTYRPIAPKSKAMFRETPISTTVVTSSDKKVLKRSQAMPKTQKLRFHMTTVVKRPKHSMMTSSMTVESPSSIANERTKTTSFILDSQPATTETAAENHITRSKNSYSNEKQSEDTEQQTEQTEPKNSPKDAKTKSSQSSTVLKDSQFQVQRIENKKDDLRFIHCHEDKHFETPNDNGRTTRSYTRRKRELTFHLYEDPETAFKTKRNCKE